MCVCTCEILPAANFSTFYAVMHAALHHMNGLHRGCMHAPCNGFFYLCMLCRESSKVPNLVLYEMPGPFWNKVSGTPKGGGLMAVMGFIFELHLGNKKCVNSDRGNMPNSRAPKGERKFICSRTVFVVTEVVREHTRTRWWDCIRDTPPRAEFTPRILGPE